MFVYILFVLLLCLLPLVYSTQFFSPVNKLEELFKAPEAAAAAAENRLGYPAVSFLAHLVVNVLQDDSDHSYNGNDERTKCQSPCVVPVDNILLR